MPIDEGVKREILARTDIAMLIGGYVQLKKRGRDLVGLCPFHNERTPSFHVHPEDGYFKCFGCGAAGDAIAFLRKLENLDFLAALRTLGARAGVALEEESPQNARRRSERETIYEANRLAARYFSRMLASREGAYARAYCEERGLSAAVIERFSLGYAPDRWEGLTAELAAAQIDPSVSVKAGLIKPSQRGGHYDFYRDRLMIPTYSTTGEIIAFGGRALGDAEPKYLNTQTTPVYTKGHHVYALNLARRAVGSDGALIVVEGYLDCIALHQAGFENAVAALGTSFTEDQAHELRKYAEHIFLCFDADIAGENAADKAINIAIRTMEHAGTSIRIVALPPGSDPDTFVRANGAPAFRELLESAKPSIEFKLEREVARLRDGFESPAVLARKGEALIREMTPMAEWDKWRVFVAQGLRIDPQDLRNSRFLSNANNFVPRYATTGARMSRHAPLATHPSAFEREVLAIMLDDPALLAEYAQLIPAHRFEHDLYRSVYERMLAHADHLGTPAEVFALFADDDTSVDLLSSLRHRADKATVKYAGTEERRMHLDRIAARLQLEDEEKRYQELSQRIDELAVSGQGVSPGLRNEFEVLASKLKGGGERKKHGAQKA